MKSGSFVYDVELSNLPEWTPTENEFRIMSANMVKFAQKSHKFERLVVSEELALDIFQDNKFKKEQIPNISQQSIGNNYIFLHLDLYIYHIKYYIMSKLIKYKQKMKCKINNNVIFFYSF